MKYRSINCTSLVNKIVKNDELFLGKYTVDIYQNCEFGCRYCDSALDKTIYIKTNAVQVFKKEIKKLQKGIIIIGSVHDPYQKAERTYTLTKDILKVVKDNNFPCHILTKSNLIMRDIDILSEIDECIVTISITTLDRYISDIFEKDVPPPKERLKVIKTLSESGIKAGLAIMPVLPHITDIELEGIVKAALEYKSHYVIYKYLELKGEQKILFQNILKERFPSLLQKYKILYNGKHMPHIKYILKLKNKMDFYCKKYMISNKIL